MVTGLCKKVGTASNCVLSLVQSLAQAETRELATEPALHGTEQTLTQGYRTIFLSVYFSFYFESFLLF